MDRSPPYAWLIDNCATTDDFQAEPEEEQRREAVEFLDLRRG